MNHVIDLHKVRSYTTEANLLRGLEKLGLDNYTDGDSRPCRYIVCRTPSGRWTAVFLATEYLRNHGGYAGFAADHGFMSI